MSSAVRFQHVPARLQRHAESGPAAVESASEQPGGLLASRAFWVGGLLSVGAWTLIFAAIAYLFF
jgi:hypothetical protein